MKTMKRGLLLATWLLGAVGCGVETPDEATSQPEDGSTLNCYGG